MHGLQKNKIKEIDDFGFSVIENVYHPAEINAILELLKEADQTKETFRKSGDLFAIRQFLKEIPEIKAVLFNDRLKKIIKDFFEEGYFSVKSIYFDKPEKSNWFVAWHQDLTISVLAKNEVDGFGPWTKKLNQYAVQPPVEILTDNFTVRIHLDDTDETNGALKVVPASHKGGIVRLTNVPLKDHSEMYCNVDAGSVMIMRPLLLHASNRTISERRRRVIHLEFSRAILPDGIEWSERQYINH
jgi:ectoine hydroxylase-related dioxygenase (phytanoyl-CoA dioxygenase family)